MARTRWLRPPEKGTWLCRTHAQARTGTICAGVGEALVRLNHLLHPLIHHQWAVKVATLSRLDEYQLERSGLGAPGYEGFLDHEQHDHMLRWVGGCFDPEAFAAERVSFDDPRMRWRLAFARR